MDTIWSSMLGPHFDGQVISLSPSAFSGLVIMVINQFSVYHHWTTTMFIASKKKSGQSPRCWRIPSHVWMTWIPMVFPKFSKFLGKSWEIWDLGWKIAGPTEFPSDWRLWCSPSPGHRWHHLLHLHLNEALPKRVGKNWGYCRKIGDFIGILGEFHGNLADGDFWWDLNHQAIADDDVWWDFTTKRMVISWWFSLWLWLRVCYGIDGPWK